MSQETEEIPEAEFNGEEAPSTSQEGSLVVASEVLPSAIPILPLRPRPAFPGLLIPMSVNGSDQVAAVQRALDSPTQALGLVLARNPEEDDGPENLHRVGVAGKIIKVIHSERGKHPLPLQLPGALLHRGTGHLRCKGSSPGSATITAPSFRSTPSSKPTPWPSSPPSRSWYRSTPSTPRRSSSFSTARAWTTRGGWPISPPT